jgi:hypothetical protein
MSTSGMLHLTPTDIYAEPYITKPCPWCGAAPPEKLIRRAWRAWAQLCPNAPGHEADEFRARTRGFLMPWETDVA